MRPYSWRHVVGLWTIVVAGILSGFSPVSAQEWFRQRSYDGQAAPVTIDMASRMRDAVEREVGIAPAARVFAATGLPVNIPDNNTTGVSSTINVPPLAAFSGIKVSLNIEHAFPANLIVTLTSPGGTLSTLSNRVGSPPSLVLTDQPVAVGGNVQGNWVLKVADVASSNTGRLVSWSLSFGVPNTALIDLTISLEANPAGDNNGNTQGAAGSAAQDKWERIVQHFADGVYEATEGAHRIRQVRIFRNSRNLGVADIRWTKKGHPHVPSNGGVGVAGGHIEMFEIFEGGGPGNADYDMLADEIGSGYTMAHEWGHFFLGLYDEYNPACGATTVSVSPSIMSSQWNAKGGDHKWLNFSIKRQAGGSFQNTLLNCQHFAYGASGWEVLARPTNFDPTDSVSTGYQSLGPRIFYPELSTVGPAGTAEPRDDLARTPQNSRSTLDILWMNEAQAMEIVIDNSGSMTGDKLINAKTAAKLLVDQAVLGQSRIGVTRFDDTVQSLFPQTLVTTEAIRASIKAAIDAIALGGNTAVGDAADFALSKLLAGSVPAGENRVVFLLTDGQSNTGVNPLSVIPKYVAAHVPLFTFGFGADADGTVLSQMASGTGGRYFFSPTTLPQIVAAFQAANAVASSSPSLGAGSLTSTATVPATLPIALDSSIDRLQLSVTYTGAALPAGAITLRNSLMQLVTATSTTTGTGGTLLFFDVPQPPTGSWQLTATTAAAGRALGYSISGLQKGIGYDVQAGLRNSSPSVTRPGPIVIEARLTRRQPVSGATVTSILTLPNNTTVNLALADNGAAPDLVASDGVYSGTYTPTAIGNYSLVIQFSNPNLLARETYRGANISPNPGGGVGVIPADVVLTENFSRSQSIQFSYVTTAAPTVTTQPASQTVTPGTNVSLVVAAIGAPPPTYQWQRRPAGAAAFSAISDGGSFSGTTTGALLVAGVTIGMSGDQYRCVMTNASGTVTSAVATLTVAPFQVVRPRQDYDGDGVSDVVVFRPQTGTWYVRYSSSNFSTASANSYQWGLPGDIPISGDFDGDGKHELTVFRPANGTWYIRYSSSGYSLGTVQTFQWGLPGDVPIAADFDGDGKTDLTVFRPSNGTWYIRYSSLAYNLGAAASFQWGLPGDVAIATDFDGDGRTDLTVWRPSNGTWYVRFSSSGYALATAESVQWGLPGDLPIAADFDGDGQTELTVWRPSNGTWYVRYSSLGYAIPSASAFQWGLPGDLPAATDFDGDGKAELTVWRPSNGTWYILYSTQGYNRAGSGLYQWGLTGDTLTR